MNPDVRRGSDDGPAATPIERYVREEKRQHATRSSAPSTMYHSSLI